MTDLTLILLLCLAPFCWNNKNSVMRNIGVWLMFICLVLLFGLRHYTVGTDSANYAFRYETLADVEPFEKGFIWLMKGLRYFSIQYTFFFIVTAGIIWGGLIKFYNKYTSLYWLAVFLFCALGGINTIANNGMRQGLAIVVFLTAIPFALEKKWLQYYLLAVIAFLFHRSAVFIFPIYFLLQIKFRWWLLVPFVIVFCGVLAFADSITQLLFSDYDKYLTEVDGTNMGKLVQLAFISCFAVSSFYYHYKTLDKKPLVKKMLLWLTAFYILCAWGVYLFDMGNALNRLAWYLFPVIFLSFAIFVEEQPPKLKWLLLFCIIGLIFCYRLGVYRMSETSSQANMIYYYRFFWQ